MPDDLLISQTKILLPQRRKELLSRPRLLELLSDLLDFRLIIIAAPAGYGKTSLLIDFSHKFEWPVCWFALDPLDNDLHRFLSHFIMSVKHQFPEFGDEALNILKATPADQISINYLVSVLTNNIYENITEHFIIVLDDYHLLNANSQIDNFLSEFIQRADDNCHVAITSRKLLTLPDLPLMVARAQVGGLSIEELVFQPDEIQRLYSQVFKKEIDLREASEIAASTEGWITGLLLTSPMLRSGLGEPIKIARASGIGLYEYLAQQVLSQQPQNIQSFLLNSSILEEFNAEMCRDVIGKALHQTEDWGKLMEAVFHNNLFVLPVDEDFKWLRYHHLFRDFLQSTLAKLRPFDAQSLWSELAEYYFNRGDWERVFDIYQQQGNTQAIAKLIIRAGSAFIARGKILKLAGWFNQLPEEMITGNASLLSIQAAVIINQGRIQEGKIKLDRAIELLKENEFDIEYVDNLIRRSTALRILGRYDEAEKDADKAIHLTSKNTELHPLFSEALRVKGTLLYQTGSLKQSLKFLNQAVAICDQEKKEEDAARILVETGAVSEQLGQFSTAKSLYERSLKYWQSVGDSVWVPTILNNLGVLQHSSGEFVDSFHNLEKSMQYAQISGNLRMEGYSLASIGDLYKDLDALDEAFAAYQKAIEIAKQIEDHFLAIYLNLAIARLAIFQKQFQKAQIQIDKAKIITEKSGSDYDKNRIILEQCALEFAKNNYCGILENLEKTMDYLHVNAQIEDWVRAQSILFTTLIKKGVNQKALELMNDFSSGMLDPAKYIPSVVAINEIKDHLETHINDNEYRDLIAGLLKSHKEFQRLRHKSRRQIRKEATVIPFAPAKIVIHSLGHTEVIVQNKPLAISDWKTQMSRDLFFLFLAHPEGLSKEEVGEYMWQELSPNELKLRFKNAIYRMRHAIGSEVVHFQDTYYQFNRSIDYEYDVQTFINLSDRAWEEKEPKKRIEAFITAVEIYRGPYLQDLDYAWVIPDRQRYHELAIKNYSEVSRLLTTEQRYDEGLFYCREALQHDSCNEEFHRRIMEIFSLMGNKTAIQKQYQQCEQYLREEIGVSPSEATISLYKSLIQQ